VNADEARLRLASARRRLSELRNGRPRPMRDDKVITSWNGLMIGALARGSRFLANANYQRAAERAAEFIFSSLYDAGTGELRRRFRAGESHHEAHLEDYAFLAEGLLDLFEATGNPAWLQRSIDLTRTQVSLFWDAQRGGFYDTSGRDASILVRTREQYDGAEPSGNSAAAMNLWRLSILTGDREFRERTEATVKAFSPWLEKQPSIMPYLATAAMHLLQPPSQVVIVGRRGEVSTEALWKECARRFLPGTARIPVYPDVQDRLAKIIPYAGQVPPAAEKATAYVCSDFVCRLPVTEPGRLGALLDEL